MMTKVLKKERIRWRTQVTGMSSLCRVSGLALKDGVSRSDNQKELEVEPLFLHLGQGQNTMGELHI